MRRNDIARTLALLLALTAPLYSQVAISGLPALSETPAAGDVIPLVDTSVGVTKKVTYSFLMSGNAASATLAATATVANSGDSATAFFSGGTIENARLDAAVSLLGQTIAAAELAVADFGDFTCNGATCSLDADSVSANELDAAGVEAELEAVLDLDQLQGNLGVAHLNSGTGASASTFWRGDGTWASAGGGSSINVEENNVEVISAPNLTGIDFLGADFDVTDDTNEANVAIAAAIARDSEVTSAVNAAVSGTAGRLPTFSGTNAVGNTNILAGADTLTLPVTTGLLIFGDGDTYIYETTDDALRIRTGGTDRLGIDTGTLSSLVAGGGTMRFTGAGSAASAIFTFATDVDNGLYYIGANNWAATAGGAKIIDYQAAQVGFLTTTGLFSAAAPTTDAAGEAGFDNNAHAASRGAVQVYDGTANTYLIGALASDTPTNGQVPKWNTGGTITWEDDTTGGGGGALNDLTDVDTTGQTTGDFLGYDGTDWGPAEVATPDNTIAFENKTINCGDPRTTTMTLPTGSNECQILRHEDNCPSLTGVADGALCFEEDANTLYVCESPEGIAGVCDATGEWTAISGGAETNDLEATDPPTILTTEVYIGTGTGTGAFAALSGDATMSNSGVVTVANDSHTHGISTGGTGQTTQTAAMDALSPTTTKGDLLVDNGTNVIRVAVGTNDQVLTADSAQASGVKWAAAPGGGAGTQYAFFQTASREAGGAAPGPGFSLGTTGSCLAAGSGTAGFYYGYFGCDAAADEDFSFQWRIPLNWDGTNLDLHVFHQWESGGTAGQLVYLDVQFGCRTPDGTENAPTLNAASTLIFTTPASPSSQISEGEITAPTLTGCAAGDYLNIAFVRDADNASDNYAVDTRFVGIELEWGTN